MADVIFTSIKKILQDANLPLALKFDNDKSQVSEYRALPTGTFPKGAIQIDIVDSTQRQPLSENIIGFKFKFEDELYTILDYTYTTATLDKPLSVDLWESDEVNLYNNLLTDELLTTFYSVSIPENRAITNKRRKIIESYELELAIYDDLSGSKSNNIIKKVCKIFSNQSYCEYDESGVKTGKHFFLELSPTFSRRDNTDLSRSYIGRVRFWKYENYNDI